MGITVGIDWAEGHHDIAIMDAGGKVVAKARIDTGIEGFTTVLRMVAEHGGTPQDTPVGIETDKNLLVVALLDAGFTVYPLNPRAVARYRERHSQSGRKSDERDAALLADVMRTDRHLHRPMPRVSDQALAIKALARQHQEAIWAWHDALNRLRSLLLEFYPQALQAFPNLKHKAAIAVLTLAPTPSKTKTLTRRRVVAALHRCGRRNDPALVDSILTALKAPGLRQPPAVEDALGVAAAQLLAIAAAMSSGVDELEACLQHAYRDHPLAHIVSSVPGLGPVLAARVLGEIGDDPARFLAASSLRCYAGTAPVTRASGRSRYVKARKVRNKRLADACHWWAFAALTCSPDARAHYDARRAAGDHHNAALRNLSNKLLGKLWWCLRHQQAWDEATAWTQQNPVAPAAA